MDAHTKTRKRKRRADIIQIIRLIVQIVFFIFLPALYINAFFDLKIVWTSIIGGSFDLAELLPQVIELIAIVPATILLGRFFCGWMCAFGAFGDFVHKIAKKTFHINFRINPKADRYLKFVKYGILIFSVVFLWTLDVPALSSASPWDVFGMIATVGALPAFGYVLANLTIGFIFFVLITVGSAFIQRFFCRYLCPLGAVFAILSVFKITTIKKQTAGCGKCRLCSNACAMGIPLFKSSSIHTGECIECLQCISACPRSNVSYSLAGSNIRPLLAGAIAAVGITGTYGFAGLALAADQSASQTTVQTEASAESTSVSGEITLTDNEETITVSESGNRARNGQGANSSSTATDSPAPADTSASTSAAPSASATTDTAVSSSQYTDGTYTGTGSGFRGATTKVTVTIQCGVITDIIPASYGDDAPYFERAFSSVSQDILTAQSSSVDAVSGATYSSQGIMQAVQDALNQAQS